jgi:crotonobetainyl-CoA:carnitine CoA-transferase CaiB-like acyl-CoA transferase
MNYFYGEYWAKGVIRKPMGTANHLSVPNQVFPTSDGSVVIIAPSDEMWKRCALALDAARLDRAEWSTILDRQRHRPDVIEAVTSVTLRLTSDEVMARLGAAKVNVAKVNNIGQAADHPQLAAIDGLIEFAMNGKPVKAVASPFAMEGAARAPDRAPPGLAQHTDEVLAELGFADDEIQSLRREGAFGKPNASMTTAASVNP